MRIDRSRFIVLVSALAAGACTATTETGSDAGSGGTQPAADSGSSADGSSAADGDTDSGPANEGGDSGTTGEGGACDDTVGGAADCSKIAAFDGGPANEGCDTTATTECTNVNANFKPKVANAWLTCLLAGQTTCSPNAYACAKTALNAACADPTADADCADIVNNCTGATAADCHALVDGLTAAGRQAVVTCSQSTTTACAGAAGIYACVEGIVQ